MTDTIQRLRELLGKATPEPWKVGALPENNYDNDESLTVEMRNSLPALLDAVEVLAARAAMSDYATGEEGERIRDAIRANPIAREAVDAARRKA